MSVGVLITKSSSGEVNSLMYILHFTTKKTKLLFYNWLVITCFTLMMQVSPYIPTITNYTKIWWVPNVVVAHQKEGIEVIHLATGRTTCKVISAHIL